MEGVRVENRGVWGVIIAGRTRQESIKKRDLRLILRKSLREGESLRVSG